MVIITKGGEPLLYEQESYILRGIWMKIYKELGPGHKESVYVKAFLQDLAEQKIFFVHEKQIKLLRKGESIGDFRPDFIIWDKIIVEFKATNFVPQVYKKQLQSYLSGSEYKLGFLVNFGGLKLTIIRLINDKAKRTSAHSAQSA